MIKKLSIALLAFVVFLASGCGSTTTPTSADTAANITAPAKIAHTPATPAKEVQVFDVSKDKAVVTFSKTAAASSESEVNVSPETSGKITQINYKVGDTVKKGATLIVLGDSAATQIADIQSSAANQGLDLAKESQRLTELSGEQSWQMAYNGTEMTSAGLQNANTGKRDAQEVYKYQLDNAEISLDMAQDAYDAIKDYLDAGNPSSPAMNKDSAKNQEKLADNGIDILKKSFASQMDQMDYAIRMAFLQYRNSINQLQMAQIGMGQQMIGAEGQVLQAESGAKMAGISQNTRYIKSPIDGVITSLSAEKGNFAAPGVPLLKIENGSSLKTEVALNSYEASLVKTGDKVTIETGVGNLEGEINWISPSADPMSKKINLEILISTPQNLIPGTMVKIVFAPQTTGKIFIPLNSVYNSDTGHYVKIIDNKNEIKFQNIEIGEITGDYVEILSGLSGTEKIATSSELFLDEGEKVKILADATTN